MCHMRYELNNDCNVRLNILGTYWVGGDHREAVAEASSFRSKAL